MSVFIIAELSASHDGSLKKAQEIVRAAADAGANAIKLQTFEPERLAVQRQIIKGTWKGYNLIDLYKQAHTPKLWHETLFNLADNLGIVPFSTPFHPEDVVFLEQLDCEMYKVSSFDIINPELLYAISETTKPVIMSTGMATQDEIQQAVNSMQSLFVTLLHCISAYPAKNETFNLSTMHDLEQFQVDVGISDHSIGHTVPVAATYMGAQVIEKHIALDRDGLDGTFASLPEEFKTMVHAVRMAEKRIGRPVYGPKEGEESSYSLRPSLHYSKDIPVGTTLRPDHVKICRPNDGMHPKYLDSVIGSKLNRSVHKDDPVV